MLYKKYNNGETQLLSREKRYTYYLTILLLKEILIVVYIEYLLLHIIMANVFEGLESNDKVTATVTIEWRIVHDWSQHLIEQKNQAWDVIRVYRADEIVSIEKE